MSDVTHILSQIEAGDPSAADHLLPLRTCENGRHHQTGTRNMKRIAILAALLLVSPCVRAADTPVFQPAGGESLDQAAFTQWVDGKETPIADDAAKDGPYSVVWTAQKRPDWRGVKFGQGRAVGVRHLRIGFTEPITVGSVLVRGGGSLSVLKPDAAYPGDLADDSQWIAAERLLDGEVSRQEVGREDYAFWVLPPGTQTRALRFSHRPSPGDPEMAGWLGGVWINEQRLGNVAPQALAQSVAREDASAKLDRSIEQPHLGYLEQWRTRSRPARIAGASGDRHADLAQAGHAQRALPVVDGLFRRRGRCLHRRRERNRPRGGRFQLAAGREP